MVPSFKNYGTALSRGTAGPAQRVGADSGRKFSGGFSRSVKTLAAGVGALLASRQVGTFLASSVKGASDLNETVNKSSIIFGRNQAGIDKWARSSVTSLGLTRQQAIDAAAGFGDMFTQLGFTGAASAKMSKATIQMSADIGSFNNLPTADVQERIAAAFRGEYDSLQKVIPNINAARVEQVALATTGKESAKQLTAQEKAAATLAIVQKDGARATGDFARTSGGLANQQKILTARWGEAKTRLGGALLPVVTQGVTLLNKHFEPAVDGVAAAFQRAQPWITRARSGLGAFVDRVRGIDVSGVAAKLAPIGSAVRGVVAQLRSVDGATVKRAVDGVATAVARLGPIVTDFSSSLPAIQPTIRAVGIGMGFVARHADLLGKALPFLIAGFAAYKAAQAANNMVGKNSIVGFGLQLGSTLALTGSNYALARSQKSVSVATVQSTATTNVGAVARIRNTAATVASTVAHRAAAVGARLFAVGQRLVNAAMVANPIGLVVVAIAALVGGLVIAYKRSETFRRVVDAVWAGLTTGAKAAFDFVTAKALLLGRNVLGLGRTVVDFGVRAVGAFLRFKDRSVALFKALPGLALAPLVFLRNKGLERITQLRDGVVSRVTALRDGIRVRVTQAKDFAVTRVTQLRDGVLSRLVSLRDGALNRVTALRDGVRGRVTQMKDYTLAAVGKLRDFFIRGFTTLRDRAQVKATELKDRVVGSVLRMRDKAISYVTNYRDSFIRGLGVLRDRAVALTVSLRDRVLGVVLRMRDRAVSYVVNYRENAIRNLTTLRDRALAFTTSLRDGVLNRITSLRDGARTRATQLRDFVLNPIRVTRDKGVEVLTQLRDAATNRLTGLRDTARTRATQLRDFVLAPFRSIRDKGVELFTQARDTIGRIWDGIQAKVKAPIKAVVGIVNAGVIGSYNWVVDKLGIGNRVRPVPGFYSGGPTPRAASDRHPVGIAHANEHYATAAEVRSAGGHEVFEAARGLARKGQLKDALVSYARRMPGYFLGGGVKPAAGAVSRHNSGYSFARWAGDINEPGASDIGHPVRAYKAGVVAAIRSMTTSYGKHIRINHAGNERTLYAHLSSFAVKAGQRVAAGQKIGAKGNTGNSSGPHLHFELLGGSNNVSSPGGQRGGSADSPQTKNVVERLVDTIVSKAKWLGSFANPAAFLRSRAEGLMSRGLGALGNSGLPGMMKGLPRKALDLAVEKVRSFPSSAWHVTTTIVRNVVDKIKGVVGSVKDFIVGNKGGGGYNLGPTKPRVKAVAAEVGPKFGIKTVYGYANKPGYHGRGLALDFMTNNIRNGKSVGDALAAYTWSRRGRYGINEQIWDRRIRTIARIGEGWRSYSGPSDHTDHVHTSHGAFDSGGMLQPGLNLAYNGTGRPEPVLTDQQWQMLAGPRREKPSKQTTFEGPFYGFTPADLVQASRDADAQEAALHPSW